MAIAHGSVVNLPLDHPLLELGHDHGVLDDLVSLELPDRAVDDLQGRLQQCLALVKIYRFL